MRISDWSSDVCSSDLLPVIGYPCVPFHRSRPMRRRIVAGNWKLHGSRAFATELLGGVAAGLPMAGVEVVVLPPLPYLGDLIEDFEDQDRKSTRLNSSH